MKRPTEGDFEVNVTGAGVEAIFKPTNSHYPFNRLVDTGSIASSTKKTLLDLAQSRRQECGTRGQLATLLIIHPATLRQWRYVWPLTRLGVVSFCQSASRCWARRRTLEGRGSGPAT